MYTSGRLYWTEQHGVKAVSGEILTKYVTLGVHAFLGSPTTDELVTRAGNGRYNDFTGGPTTGVGSIYWTSSIGPCRSTARSGRSGRRPTARPGRSASRPATS
ncbi:hypothetical protein ABT256_19355 [Amycolatopsis japonica]|uniref:LGFP repeat-containing protein n=1 Tax=Amycolatopsis japonica TaxID=208439 RepID=UPI0033285129